MTTLVEKFKTVIIVVCIIIKDGKVAESLECQVKCLAAFCPSYHSEFKFRNRLSSFFKISDLVLKFEILLLVLLERRSVSFLSLL